MARATAGSTSALLVNWLISSASSGVIMVYAQTPGMWGTGPQHQGNNWLGLTKPLLLASAESVSDMIGRRLGARARGHLGYSRSCMKSCQRSGAACLFLMCILMRIISRSIAERENGSGTVSAAHCFFDPGAFRSDNNQPELE